MSWGVQFRSELVKKNALKLREMESPSWQKGNVVIISKLWVQCQCPWNWMEHAIWLNFATNNKIDPPIQLVWSHFFCHYSFSPEAYNKNNNQYLSIKPHNSMWLCISKSNSHYASQGRCHTKLWFVTFHFLDF